MGRSMLGARAIAVVRRHQRDLFATGLAMASPQVDITLSRYNTITAEWGDLDPQTVLVRWTGDKGQARLNSQSALMTPLATSPTPLDGIFTAVDPFNVQTGDRFTLDGLHGHIGTVWPVRNGRRRAGFVLDADSRGAP